MTDASLKFSDKLKLARKIFQSHRAEQKRQFPLAIQLLDEVAEIRALGAADHVRRAWLLLKCQKIPEAQAAFSSLRKSLEGSSDPELRYLRHFCTAMLGMIAMEPAVANYESKQALTVPCSRRLRRQFPLFVMD
jgi:hypothetical protein